MDPVTAALNFATAALNTFNAIWADVSPDNQKQIVNGLIDLFLKAQPHASSTLAAPPKAQ